MDKLWREEAWEAHLDWHNSDRRLWERINELIKEIERNPFKGTGRPHPLKYRLQGNWSRSISHEHRLVYQIEKNVLVIVHCYGHYD